MPARATPFLADHYYHIYNRGVNKAITFFEEENYRYFVRLLKKNLARYSIRIVAYCLMPNHFHLLLNPSQNDNLSAFMKSLLGSYSQAINKQRIRQGPLYQGRFQSIVVDKEEYLIHLARYIHTNPVNAEMVKSPRDWQYSNYLDIIGRRGGTLKDSSIVPERFPTGGEYRKFVEEYWQDTRKLKELEKYLID
ncbi:MAG TPA: transposase [Anaerolineales bacterium]|nr:transposase [Anaerolineales bacterium]